MKLKAILILCAVLVCSVLLCPAREAPVADTKATGLMTYVGTDGVALGAQAAALMEATTGTVILARNGDRPLPMASTTKIMTAALVLEGGELDRLFAIPKEAVGVEGSSLYLAEGEVFTIRELLYGLMLESGNDCAVALAIATSGNVDAFVESMNSKAIELGLSTTHFANPHGLSAPGHYTTATELAKITAYALRVPGFAEIASTVSIELVGEGHLPRYLCNHNKLLRAYDGMIGVKTGYTKAAGRCLVTAAARSGMTLIAVTLNDRQDWDDHKKMLDYGFSSFKTEKLCSAGDGIELTVKGGKGKKLFAVVEEERYICLPNDAVIDRLYTTPTLKAPIKKGDTVASLKIYANGVLVEEIPLYARKDIKKKIF